MNILSKIKQKLQILTVLTVAVFVVSTAPALDVKAQAENPNDLIIFVNKASAIDTVDIDDLRLIFLKKRTHWDSGGKVIPIHAKDGTKLRDTFRTRVLEWKSYEEQSYWQNQQIRLGLDHPVELINTQKAVFKLKKAVSYCYRQDLHKDIVKIIMVVPN